VGSGFGLDFFGKEKNLLYTIKAVYYRCLFESVRSVHNKITVLDTGVTDCVRNLKHQLWVTRCASGSDRGGVEVVLKVAKETALPQ
jgi:hypothetical protein